MIISHEVYIIIMIRLSSMSELINSWMGQSTKFKGQWWPADSANSTISTMERANSAQGKGRIRDPPRVSGRCIFMCQEAERLRYNNYYRQLVHKDLMRSSPFDLCHISMCVRV